MKKEYDFSKAERGRFYRPDAKLHLPVHLDDEVRDFVSQIAASKRTGVTEVVNDLLRSDIRLAKALR